LGRGRVRESRKGERERSDEPPSLAVKEMLASGGEIERLNSANENLAFSA
jgi:hypothetical protein